MMGTSGLMTSPVKQQQKEPLKCRSKHQQNQHRTKISTVYLPPNPQQQQQGNQKCCDTRVTVNGRHHCNCGSRKEVKRKITV